MAYELKDKCGVFGVFGKPEASYLTYLGLYSLQHRGEESAGIISSDGKTTFAYRGMGHVQDVFDEERLKKLRGDRAIGHVRYSTTGSSNLKNAQPVLVDYSKGEVAIAHNGNLINADILRAELEAYGSIFQTTSDSEIIVHLMAKPSLRNIEEGLMDALKRVRGAYSLVLLSHDMLMAARDPHGFRPLWLGKMKGGGHLVSSETCAFDMLEAEAVREVEPGEVLFINAKGVRSVHLGEKPKQAAHCIFEHVYFARPDSNIFGDNVHLVRCRLGRQLAKEQPADADIVIPVPDSGNSAALGFSQESGIPLETGIIRNHYVGRTFIQPSQGMRDFKVRVKFNFVEQVLAGKRVVVVDDSIVRGTTSKTRVRNLRKAGAKEVHLRISCPPHQYPCAYGIDFPTRGELIANKYSPQELKKYFDCDSVGYLSLEGMLRSTSLPPQNYCTACWTGKYPIPFKNGLNKYHAEKC